MSSKHATGGRPNPTRRGILRGASGLGGLAVLGGCGAVAGAFDGDAGGPGAASVLLPLSGASAELGARLDAAARLGGGPGIGVEIRDSGSTPEAAAAAAREAAGQGARMLIGPLFAEQARAASAALPRGVPMVTLSNDASLAGGGRFVFGVTPAQSARAVFGLAAQRGIRDVAIVVPPGRFGAQSIETAGPVAQAMGLRLRAPIVTADPGSLAASLGAGGLPDAVYLPAAGASLQAFAGALPAGVQVLGSVQWSAAGVAQDRALRGAWFAAPDPLRFAAFSDAFEEATGEAAGIVAGLVYDGVQLARTLGQAGAQTARGLTREEGFDGVLGPYRFLPSGLAQRGLAVLEVGAGDINLIGATSV